MESSTTNSRNGAVAVGTRQEPSVGSPVAQGSATIVGELVAVDESGLQVAFAGS